MSIRLIAVDLDDTLLTDDLEIAPGAARAIAAAQAKGVHVVIATGRMFPSAQPIAQQLNLKGPQIVYNGAMVKTTAGELLWHRPLPRDLALELLDFAAENDWTVHCCYLNDRLYVPAITAAIIYYTEIAGVPAQSVSDMRGLVAKSDGPTKLLAIGSPEATTERAERLTEHFGDRLMVTISKPSFVEMLQPGVSKATALAQVAQQFDVAQDEVLAIGDSFNDLDMLQWAGIGVAVGNGHPEVQKHADHVVESNNNDGVAEAIERFVLA